MVNLRITFNPIEADALGRLAASELRDVRDQIRWLVRQELERKKMLPTAAPTGPQTAPVKAAAHE